MEKKDYLKKALDGVKLQDVGHKFSQEKLSSAPLKEKYYPSLSLSNKEAEFLKDCKVGDKETFLVEAILRSKSTDQNTDGRDHVHYMLEVRKIGKLNT